MHIAKKFYSKPDLTMRIEVSMIFFSYPRILLKF